MCLNALLDLYTKMDASTEYKNFLYVLVDLWWFKFSRERAGCSSSEVKDGSKEKQAKKHEFQTR